jgi:molybdate transport system substrate-binding protein
MKNTPLDRRAVLMGFASAAGLAIAPDPVRAQPRPVTVFAAASLQNALDDVVKAYGGQGVRVSYAASSAIARQIAQGAPADIFISADPDWMDWLAQRNLILPGSRVNLLSNHLALVAPAASTVRLELRPGVPLTAALGPSGRLAIAGPDVPAGRYAQASLEALGVWPSVESRLARGENVRATLAFVARGEAPLGIVYDTDARSEPAVRIVGLFPDASHPPIVYPAALVAGSRNPDSATFLAFVRGPAAAAVFRRYGFRTLS